MKFRTNVKNKAKYGVMVYFKLDSVRLDAVSAITPVIVLPMYLLKASEITVLLDGHETYAMILMHNGNELKYIPEYDGIANKGRIVIRYKSENGETAIAWTNIAINNLGPTISRDVIKQLRKYPKLRR